MTAQRWRRPEVSASISVALLLLPFLLVSLGGLGPHAGLLGAATAVAAACLVGAVAVRLAAVVLQPSGVSSRRVERCEETPARQQDPTVAGNPMPRAPGAVALPRVV